MVFKMAPELNQDLHLQHCYGKTQHNEQTNTAPYMTWSTPDCTRTHMDCVSRDSKK